VIKILYTLLFSSIYLYSASFWTLTGINKASTYIKNDVSSLSSTTVQKFKPKMLAMLKKENIKTDQQDSPILMLTLKEIENDNTHYIYINLALGEEVQTFRDNKANAFAITYTLNDFIEVDDDEIDNEVLESLDYLLSEFQEQFEDDLE